MDAGKGRVALVTGAASGIGRATALELAVRGWEVVGLDRAAGEGVAVTVDVTDTAAVAAAVAGVGRVDLLANVAGTGSTQNVVETPPELWDAVFAVNVRGIFNTCRAVLPGMVERGGGAIVNAASIAGMVGLRDRAAYCASKGAVIALTKAMAIDHVGDGIRVNCVCPGTVDTPWVGRLLEQSGDPEAMRAALVARQPMGRLGRAEEVAKAIAYLASDDAAFVTGTELVIDGGLVAG
ncbi:SDR family oxidoreductase [Conexibacter sp. JD483]|uniref:SDR family NAD(P)-dependent oxidoreductase n=1 Tax=unclassified Conexibacter TaxID=2627773 RepID=UPI002725BC26|nr:MULTISPECIES: SDR family oxidoreductase [unclassified Conexibacter]MDO8186959.1 SDR family oxidoreductase [Conexibacter sp. CPCC 205706]MDO8200586.1 SDR family oxidoreductase [Conexibacter sp. CPCC 205762]MDR9368836.1 SDR family oxidoreductase [Conexibacter sp. JD483]